MEGNRDIIVETKLGKTSMRWMEASAKTTLGVREKKTLVLSIRTRGLRNGLEMVAKEFQE
jgi:hypothetical protein